MNFNKNEHRFLKVIKEKIELIDVVPILTIR